MRSKCVVGQDALLLAIFAIAVAAYLLSVALTGNYAPLSSPALAQEEVAQSMVVDSRTVRLNGVEVGEVTIAEEVLLRIRTAAGSHSVGERARLVADRLQQMVTAGLQPGQVHAGMMAGSAAVMAGDQLIITAYSEQARLNATAPGNLAIAWARNIANALGGDPGEPQLSAYLAPAREWRPAEPYDDKDVPVISVGRGVRIGMARVAGPRSKVRQVQAVAQLESRLAQFGDVEIYVPISTQVPGKRLDRVNECAVVGLADLKIL